MVVLQAKQFSIDFLEVIGLFFFDIREGAVHNVAAEAGFDTSLHFFPDGGSRLIDDFSGQTLQFDGEVGAITAIVLADHFAKVDALPLGFFESACGS